MSELIDSWASEPLAQLERDSLRRKLEPLESPVGARVRIASPPNGVAPGGFARELINFSSNDYLGFAADRELVSAAHAALDAHGVGAGASRLVVGDTTAHQSLERALAKFEGTEAALLFNSGYAANVGALTALFGPGDVLFSDALNHASLIDGCRLSRAKVVVYQHGDVEALEALLRENPGRRRAVVTDAVFSMDGDRAPLAALRELSTRHHAALFVDEAHATGVLGATGRGLCELEGVTADVHVGTLSKALGSFGGFVCGSVALRELLLNRARTLIFSTALPAAVCAAAERALELVREGSARRRLDALREQLGAKSSAILPVMLGSAENALRTSARLREAGLLVKAIRPPTVPEGTSRLRIALTAAHTHDDVARLCAALGSALHPGPLPALQGEGGIHDDR